MFHIWDAGKPALGHLKLRLITEDERELWNSLVDKHHSLGSRLVGPQLRYVAELDGEWAVLLSIGQAAHHLADREAFIGWDDTQRGRRLKFIGQNTRLLIMEDRQQFPNMMSHVMRQLCRRVSDDWDDWEAYQGNPLFGLETFVDPRYFSGACYKACGWQPLGFTKGYGRVRKDFYECHNHPKELYFRVLWNRGMKMLARKQMSEPYQTLETEYRQCPFAGPVMRCLFDMFSGVDDPRKRRGHRYPLQTLLTIIAMATACGMKGHKSIASFASHLSQNQRRMLRCPKDKRSGKYRSPGETCIREILYATSSQQVEDVLAEWMARQVPAQRPNIVMDGKTIKGTAKRDENGNKIEQLHLVMACTHDGRMIMQESVDKKENEIVAVRKILERLPPLRGTVITGDAMNTQQDISHTIVWKKGGTISGGSRTTSPRSARPPRPCCNLG